MTKVLQLGQQQIPLEQLPFLLDKYELLPALAEEMIIDQAIASIDLTPEEQPQGVREERGGLRRAKIHKFKQLTWGHELKSHFLKYRRKLDRATYYLLRHREEKIIQELYFRLQEKEQSFAELAREYSQGSEAKRGGLVNGVQLSTLHPTLAAMLSSSEPGEILPVTKLDDWYIIVSLQEFIPAQFNETLQQQLLEQLFQEWLEFQLSLINVRNLISVDA